MESNNHINPHEITALIKLVEDPDPFVFEQVREKLVSFGKSVVPNIEHSWTRLVKDNDHQERLSDILREIKITELKQELIDWKDSTNRDLLKGAYIISKFQFPDLKFIEVEREIEMIKQKVWLEINEDNTAFEIVKIFNHVLFDIIGFKPNKSNFHAPQNSYINTVLKHKQGNPLSLSVVYSIIAQKLEIPIYGVNLPNQFVLGYLDENSTLKMLDAESDRNVLFYINPFSKGRIFDHNEIENYLRSLNLPLKNHFIEPCSNTDILKRMLKNLAYSYHKVGQASKVQDIKDLSLIL
ncbi:MAG: transglutaminase-like domain-containing protein [Putridiphycobacter sp.]